MLKKFFVALCFFSMIFVQSAQLEAAPIKLGVVKFQSPADLSREADLITNTFIKVLADSNAITVLNRNKTDNISGSLEAVSDFGKNEGCKYMLIGSVNRDKDIVISARVIDVDTAKILFSMSVVEPSFNQESTITLGNRIRERLTGEYPKVNSIKGRDIYINRGSSAGIRKGDLYIVREEYAQMIDKDGNTIGRSFVDLAVVEIKSVQKDASIGNIYKKAGILSRLHTLINKRIDVISKNEADNLIRQKTFSLETIRKNTSEAQDNTMSVVLNPNLPEEYDSDFENLKRDAEKGHPVYQRELGYFYLRRKNFPLALKWLQEAANQGNIEAHNDLGYMYANGLGVSVNYKKAFELFSKAAEKGNAMAQFNVGSMYQNGEGTKQDTKKALMWYERAAKQGNTTAQIRLAMMYQDGDGVKKDVEKAVSLYKQAAEKNNAIAMINLGLFYSKFDKDASREWYTKALEQGRKERNDEIIKIARDRLEELSNLNNSGAEQYIEAAEKGDAIAQYNLGLCYENGRGIKRDYKKAVEWYSKAANQGYTPAQNSLGIMYINGLGVKQSSQKAAELFSKAAENGDKNSQYNLGLMYELAQGVTQDYTKAAELYNKASKQGYAPAQFRLGYLYMRGLGIKQDTEKAVELYQKSAQSGNTSALNHLALMYEFGISVPKDINKAIELYRQAANKGDEIAKKNLERIGAGQ